jgi:RNA polymerase sigma factor (sigma-70 family)
MGESVSKRGSGPFFFFFFYNSKNTQPAKPVDRGDEENNNRDQLLIDVYRRKPDVNVLAELYKPYMSLVYGVCLKYLKNREESRDAVMQIFENLVTTLPKHEVKHFKGWLYTLTRNFCLMRLRAEKGRFFEDLSPELMETDSFLHPDDDLDQDGRFERLEKCIDELNTEQKQCVQLFYIRQKCYREIVEATGYDANKVKSYIQNGKRNLKMCMERNG